MLVSSDSGAAEIVSSDAETRFYDDVGCLAADWKAHPPDGVAFVHLPSGRWSDAREVWYARPIDAHTAMSSGLVAYATETEARAADREGRALAFTDVVGGGGVRK